MSPLIFINGVIFASSAAITLGLAVTLFIALLVGDESAILAAEVNPLLTSVGLYAAMTAVSGLSFLGVVRRHPWRWVAFAGMLAVLVLLFYYYWPG